MPSMIKQQFLRQARLGFTMLELMVVIAIVAILASVAIPSFRTMIERNRVAGAVNQFVGDLQFARSEAIKRGSPVVICASTDGATCSGANAWHSGWLVYNVSTPLSPTTVCSACRLRTRSALTSSDTLVADSNVTSFTYGREGFAANMAGTVTMALHTSPVNDDATRCIEVARNGHQAIRKKGEGACS